MSIRLALVASLFAAISTPVAAQQQPQQQPAADQPLDRDGNGVLTAEEFAGLVNPQAIPADPAPLMQAFDANGDGIITLVEYRVRTQANFDAVDSDRDGVVTNSEMQAAGIVVN